MGSYHAPASQILTHFRGKRRPNSKPSYFRGYVCQQSLSRSMSLIACRMMYHVLQILLHRPFLSYGHLHKRLPNMALDSFSTCASAAESIAMYLDSYKRTHTFRSVPYPLLYTAFVSATIHVRIAAQKQLETNAIVHLITSLRVFDANLEGRPSAQKARFRIEQLMK